MDSILPDRLLALVRPGNDLVLRRIRNLKRCVQVRGCNITTPRYAVWQNAGFWLGLAIQKRVVTGWLLAGFLAGFLVGSWLVWLAPGWLSGWLWLASGWLSGWLSFFPCFF